MSSATLSFTLRPAGDWSDLIQAAGVRAASYGHHTPSLRSMLESPDEVDLSPSTAVFLCHDKRTGDAVGTARVQVTTRGPLMIDQCIDLPDDMTGHSRAEITRMAARSGADPLVKLALMKAGYLYCLATQVRWMVIGARNEALIRQYRRLGFSDLYATDRMVPLSYTGGILHRILRFDVTAAERTWLARRHPLYPFMIETVHPDIQVIPQLRIKKQPSQKIAA